MNGVLQPVPIHYIQYSTAAHHAHCQRIELDALSIRQAQRTVVIQDSVHVFYPHCIHRAVKHNPFAVWGGVRHSCTDDGGRKAVGPFVCEEVVLPIQLPHIDALGVECVGMRHLQAQASTVQLIPFSASTDRYHLW